MSEAQQLQPRTEAPMPGRFWSIRDVASFLNISERIFRELRATGRFPKPCIFGRSLRWDPDVVRSWAKAQEAD